MCEAQSLSHTLHFPRKKNTLTHLIFPFSLRQPPLRGRRRGRRGGQGEGPGGGEAEAGGHKGTLEI